MGEVQRLLHDPAFFRLGLTLVHFLWQGLLVALLAFLVQAVLRPARPAARYLVLLGLLGLMAALPVLTFTLWTKAPPPAVMTVAQTQRLLAAAARQRGNSAAQPRPAAGPTSGRTVARTSRRPLAAASSHWLRRMWWQVHARLPVAGLLWMTGVVVLLAQLLVQWGLFVRVVGRSVVAEDRWRNLLTVLSERLALRRAVRLLQSVETGAPIAAGWLRPAILLPPAVLLGLTPEQVEAVLAHELAHTRRHDFLVNTLQRVVEVVLFYHPAVWWLSGMIRAERELCCDDVAAAACGDAVGYARALARVAELHSQAPEPAMAMARRPVAARVRRLVLPVEPGHQSVSWSTLLLPSLAIVGIALVSGIAPVGGQPYVNGTLVYQESATGWKGLYWERSGDVARVISGRATWKVEDPAPVSLLQYSPHGDKVLFPRRNDFPADPKTDPGGWATDVWEADVDALGRPDFARAVNLVERAGLSRGDNGNARWSPDGRRLFLYHWTAVRGDWLFRRELWVMNAEGSNAHEIRIPGWLFWGASWEPDSKRLRVLAMLPKDNPRAATCPKKDCASFLVEVDGAHARRLPLDGWLSPDGQWMVGLRRGHYWWKLVLTRADGSGERTLLARSYHKADLPQRGEERFGLGHPLDDVTPSGLAWAPGSRQIAFVWMKEWNRKGPAPNLQRELFVYDLPSGELTQMTHDSLEQCTPVWME